MWHFLIFHMCRSYLLYSQATQSYGADSPPRAALWGSVNSGKNRTRRIRIIRLTFFIESVSLRVLGCEGQQGSRGKGAMTRSLRRQSRFSDFHTWLLLELTRETSDRGESFLPGLHVLVSISLRGRDMDMHEEWGEEWGEECQGSGSGGDRAKGTPSTSNLDLRHRANANPGMPAVRVRLSVST